MTMTDTPRGTQSDFSVIRPIRSEELDEAISVIAAAVQSVYGSGDATPEILASVRSNLIQSGSLDDMRNLSASYEQNGGLFLVLVDDGRVVGTGALKRLDFRTGELGRMWFLPAYRGRGLGKRMAQQLLAFAREQRYERVLLDTSERCTDAIALFRKLGFQESERYKTSPTTVFMELRIGQSLPSA
jgi:putative acetyltransferase